MATEDKTPGRVDRRSAKSKDIDYTTPVVLHESTKQRVELVTFYVERSNKTTDVSLKITTYGKAPPPDDWHEYEEKSLSLQDAAARKLHRALGERLAVAREGTPGQYLTIPMFGGTADLKGHDPKAVAGALSAALSQPGIGKHLAGLDLSAELVAALQGAIRISDMRTAMASLREMLETVTEEQAYQAWCEKHCWVFGNAYVMRDDVRSISSGDQLDMLLPTVVSGLREIVKLKRPNMDVILFDKNHNSYYFSSDVSKAVGQCHRYIDVLHNQAQKGLLDHPEVVAYHPRAIIVIGRSKGWSSQQARGLHGLNYRLSGVVVMTYDQLLAQGERLIDILGEPTLTEE